MSNRFWGWGREDDEFYRRIKGAGLQVMLPHPPTRHFLSHHGSPEVPLCLQMKFLGRGDGTLGSNPSPAPD